MSIHPQPSPLPKTTLLSPSRKSHTSHRSRDITPSPATTKQPSTPSPRGSSSSHSTRKQASYSETALQIASSPPLTSFLNDRHSASSAQEEAYLKQSLRLRIARLVLSGLTIALALAALGVEGHVLKSYNDTKLGRDWHLTLWPINIDLKPTLGILVPAALVAVAHLGYVAVAAIPSPHSRTSLLANFHLLTSLTSLVLAVFALTFAPILTYRVDPRMRSLDGLPRDTIHSFTCRYYREAQSFNSQSAKMGIPMFGEGINSPAGFGRLCVETEVGVGLMVAVGALCLVGAVVGGCGKMGEGRIERGRRERWEGKWEGKA